LSFEELSAVLFQAKTINFMIGTVYMAIKIQKDIPYAMVEKFSDETWGAKQLRSIMLFKQFTENELISLYNQGEIIALSPQCHAVVEGEATHGLFVILHGSLSVHKTNPSTGSIHRIAYLDQGASFGEMSLLDRAPRSATVVSESLCYLFYLDAAQFDHFLEVSGDNLKFRFYKTCAEDLSDRFRTLNSEYIQSQQLLWKYALRKPAPPGEAPDSPESRGRGQRGPGASSK
jgi:hypothetical protein